MQTVKIKGKRIFYQNIYTTFCSFIEEYDQPKDEQIYVKFDIYRFCELAKASKITHKDGKIINIIINGYETNLGLKYYDINDGGELRLNRRSLSHQISKEKDVYINWKPYDANNADNISK